MDDGQAAMRVIANDPDVRRLSAAPTDQGHVSRPPVARDRLAEVSAQPRPQLVVPRLAAVTSRRVQRLRPARFLHGYDQQADAVYRPRLAALVAPAHADHLPRLGDHSLRAVHSTACARTSPAQPPPPRRFPPGTEPATPSPTGIVHSPLKFGQLL